MTITRPLVSVIIPTYNHGRFLGDAIRSVLCQTYDNIEIIIVDNFSEDNTLDVLSQIKDPRVKVFQFNNRGIIAASRNFGAKQATGAVLSFLDSDDMWMPDKLARQIPHIEELSVSCVGSDFLPIGDSRYYKQHLSFAAHALYRDHGYEEVVLQNPVMTSSAILRARDFHSVGGFDEHADFRFIEDWELWLRMSRYGAIRVLNEPLIAYRIVRNKYRDMRDVSLRTLKVLMHHNHLGYIGGKILEAAIANCYLMIGKACLDRRDRVGVHYYWRGFLKANQPSKKARAIGGLMLFFVPFFLRHAMLEAYYRLPFGNPYLPGL